MGQAMVYGFQLGDDPVIAPARSGITPEQMREDIARGIRCCLCGNELHPERSQCYEADDPAVYAMFGISLDDL